MLFSIEKPVSKSNTNTVPFTAGRKNHQIFIDVDSDVIVQNKDVCELKYDVNAENPLKWKFIKVYYNAYVKDFLNIFAISYPLNNFFDSNFLLPNIASAFHPIYL